MVIRLILAAIAILVAACGSAVAASPAARLTVVVEHPDRPIHPNEMVLVHIRGFYRVPITLEKLEVPDMPGFRVVRVGPDEWFDVMDAGLATRGFERTLALYPQRSGEIVIPPLVHKLTVMEKTGGRGPLDVVSEPVRLTVEPVPAGMDSWWFPARSVKVTETWSVPPDGLSVGQATQRTLTIVAEGVTDDQVPPLPTPKAEGLVAFPAAPVRETVVEYLPQTPMGEALRQRLTRPERLSVVRGEADGPVATVSYTWTIRPYSDEPSVLPDLEIPWFDTTTGTTRTVLIPGRTVSLMLTERSLEALEAMAGIVAVAPAAPVAAPDRGVVAAVFAFAALVGGGLAVWSGRIGMASPIVRAIRWAPTILMALALAHWRRMTGRGDVSVWRASGPAIEAARGIGWATTAARLTAERDDAARLLFGRPADR